MPAKQAERVLSIIQVTSVLEESLKKTFQCTIAIYREEMMIFTFFDHGDDFLSIRIAGAYYSIVSRPVITDQNLTQLSNAFRRAAECMNVLGAKPISTVVEELEIKP